MQSATEATRLTAQQEQAALHIAEGRLTDGAIAAALGVSRASILRWKKRAAFQSRVTVLQQTLSEAIVNAGIAERQARVDALNDRWKRMRVIMHDRADDPEMRGVPGGRSGLLVRTYKQVGVGADASLLPEYTVDAPLLRELREHEKQAAQELGQWAEKREVAVTDVEVTISFDRRSDAADL